MDQLKAGETTVNYEIILQENDPALNPANRPPINEAIDLILGHANGYEVPFAAVPLKEHAELPEQNLYSCLFGRDSLVISDLLFDVKPHLRMIVISALALNQGKVLYVHCSLYLAICCVSNFVLKIEKLFTFLHFLD